MDKRPRNDLIGRKLVTGAIVTQAAGRVNENATQAKVSVMDKKRGAVRVNDSSHLRVSIKPRPCCGSALLASQQILIRVQRSLRAIPDRDHNLLARFIGHVACGKKAGDTGLAGGINDNAALRVQRNPTSHQVGVRSQPELHEHHIHVECALGAIRPLTSNRRAWLSPSTATGSQFSSRVTWSATMSFRPR